jgi:hypothetical protein
VLKSPWIQEVRFDGHSEASNTTPSVRDYKAREIF